MAQATMHIDPAALQAKKQLMFTFRKRGITIGIFSAITYGLYTAFMTLGMANGVWAEWYSENSGLSAFVTLYLLSAVGAAVTDLCGAIWALGCAGARGRLGDFFRCIRTKPGFVVFVAATIGGPIGTTAYVAALQLAGPIVVPISALVAPTGAILSRILFKQELTPRMMLGIAICVAASAIIGSTTIGEGAAPHLFVGVMFGALAALCWGTEGCVCGYASSIIDPEIGIAIRQVTSSCMNILILIPLFSYIGGTNGYELLGTALMDMQAMPWIFLGGLNVYLTYMLWYKGNGMCGAPLGMACNGTFSFWTPLFCWLLLGVIMGIPGWTMAPINWICAVVMVFGITLIALNPLDYFKKESN